jgi:hypothetical protein
MDQAGFLLNSILENLCGDHDLVEARSLHQFTFNGPTGSNEGPYILPDDYLRVMLDGATYTVDGLLQGLIHVRIEEYDWLSQVPGIENFPRYLTTRRDLAPPQLFVWPRPMGSYPVQLRYFRRMPDIVNPAQSTDVPWFPNSNYLITRLAGELMKLTNDDRAGAWLSDARPEMNNGIMGAGYLLAQHKRSQDDVRGAPPTIKLDRRFFRRGRRSGRDWDSKSSYLGS